MFTLPAAPFVSILTVTDKKMGLLKIDFNKISVQKLYRTML